MLKEGYPQYEDLDLEREQADRRHYEFPTLFEVSEDEGLELYDKDIHITTFVTNKDQISLDNCRVVYNEESESGAFILEPETEFVAKDCVFICSKFSENPLIKTKGANVTISFENCLFVNCCSFISADDSAQVIFTDCEMENCYHDFAVCRNSYFEINRSKILYTDEFVGDEAERRFNRADVLIYTDECEGGMSYVQCVWDKNAGTLLYLKGLTVENCYFQDMPFPLNECGKVKECMFTNCNGAVGSKYCRYGHGLTPNYTTDVVENCDFFCCSNTLHNVRQIKNCQFESNFGFVIRTKSTGIVSNCYFKEIDGTDADDALIIYPVSENMNVKIEKCVFEDCNFGLNWCIGPHKNGVFVDKPKNPVVNIEMCSFKNCSAADELQGAFIYPGPLYKQRIFRDNKPVHGVIHIVDCSGTSENNPWSISEKLALIKRM